jgi:hypothetical protein
MESGSQCAGGDAPSIFRRNDIDELILGWISRWKIAILIGLGIAFRVVEYLHNRGYWLDEHSVADNIRKLTYVDMFGPLRQAQLAPAGFLIIERSALRLFGDNALALRLFPLASGIAALFLVRALAERFLRPGAVWIAVGLTAVSDDLIYFCTELKQYSSDVALGLVCYFLVLKVESRPLTVVRALGFGAAGAAILWFSHPSIFVLAGLGTVLMGSAVARRDWRRSGLLVLMGSIWLLSFTGVVLIARRQLGYGDAMWVFWSFAFPPPFPPRTFWEASWGLRRLLYLFVNPLNFTTPAGIRLSALPALVFCLVGCVSCWRRSRERWLMLTLPCAYTLLAGYLRQYPFHGRLVLFLVPALLMLIAEGAQSIREAARSRLVSAVVLAALFLFPTVYAAQNVVTSRIWTYYNLVGDRRPKSLDSRQFPW